MSIITLCIPAGVCFADLRLALEVDGDLSFDVEVIRRICTASGVDADAFIADEDALGALIVSWYRAHRAQGGEPDTVAEAIAAEVATEDARGQHFSLPPGRA